MQTAEDATAAKPHSSIKVRDYQISDIDALIALFLSSIREVASRHYTPEQINAWTSRVDRNAWMARRASKLTFVAEIANEVVGFSDLETDGHIDMMYVHPGYQGRGVARALLQHVTSKAEAGNVGRLYTEASITARPFFERHGFIVTSEQEVGIGGERLRNYCMERELEIERRATLLE